MTFEESFDEFAGALLKALLILAPVFAIMAVMICEIVDSSRYNGISGKIVIERLYDGSDNCNATIDECRKALDEGGFVVDAVERVRHGDGMFIRMSGRKMRKSGDGKED